MYFFVPINSVARRRFLPICPEIEINGEKYKDGGISDSIPYMQAIKAGCDKNIVVLTRPKGYVKTKSLPQSLP